MSKFNANDFLAFCKTKPADEKYDFTEPSECAVAQYAQSRNIEKLKSCSSGVLFNTLGEKVFRCVLPEISGGEHQDLIEACTFGKLADRLEKALA